METRGRFQLHLPGLLKVLAEHLYSTQRVGIRELIQNAHDTCTRRIVEHAETGYRPRIDVTFDTATRTLRVTDNGCGLTEADINNYLTVIGRGYTRELRERLVTDDSDASQDLIGQFGVGFLSAFLLGSEVTVETRPMQGPPLRWHSTGDEEFDLTPGTREEVGTTVVLKLKPSAFFLLNADNLLEVVKVYADFLPIPIYLNHGDRPANECGAPWDEFHPEQACREYVQRRFQEADPLWILPLHDGTIDLGHDTLTIPLRGFLFVPRTSVVSIKEYGSLAVYIRKMAICEADQELLPAWARFVRGLIDCPALQPTASREAVHQDEAFEAVRRVIADQLSHGLRDLAENSPEVWKRIASGHSDIIMGWAAKDRDFFEMVADTVPLRTSRGRLTLPEYLLETTDTLYYTTRDLGSLQDKILAEARDVPAIDASWFSVPTFLHSYAELHPKIKLVQLDDDLKALLRPARHSEFAELVALCDELGFTTQVTNFKPADLPAIMTYSAEAETLRGAEDGLKEGLFPEGFSGFVQDYVDRKKAEQLNVGTLHLNVNSPLLRRLAASEIPTARKQAALAVIAYFAKLFCGRLLDASEATEDLGIWQRSLNHLI